MASTITAEKAALRKAVKEIRLSSKEKADSDDLLLRRFLALPQVVISPSILLYYGIGNEPDTARLLKPLKALGKEVFLPCCLPGGLMEARRYEASERLVPGLYGIPEPKTDCPPAEKNSLPLILVPGLCFDLRGFRLGHGGGYYDRYLSGYEGLTVALCRDRLLRPTLPTEAHDRPVDLLLTETRCLSPLSR